jgi:glycosyltransferase involved in cell wall biosynthesis
VITISEYCASALRRCYDYRGPVSVVPEAIDLDAWHGLFKEHGGSPDIDRFTILSVCRFFPRKRLDVLLRAVALALRGAPEMRLRIVGDGPEREPLRALAHRLGLEGIVEWLGPVSQSRLSRELTAADCFCLPSAQEGFGIAFLEAMAAGLPIVAARAAAVPEVVPQALLCPPDDAESFADALLSLYDSRELRDRLAATGKEQVRRFSLPVVSDRFLREVESLITGAGG